MGRYRKRIGDVTFLAIMLVSTVVAVAIIIALEVG
jgi:hypothetical protein